MKVLTSAVGVATAMLLSVTTAQAQTAGTTASGPAPSVNMAYAGVFVGIGAVQNAKTIAGGEAGVRVFHNVDVIVDGGWDADGVTRRRVDLTSSFATLLQKSTGKTATASVTAPVKFGLAGLRYVIDMTNDFHAYVLAEAGRASLEYKPVISINGTDVTNSLATYGATLGSDLTGTEAAAAFGGGVGVWYTRGSLFADASLRLLNIQTATQSTNLTRAHIGLGVRF